MKQIAIIIFSILLLGSISAIYQGESINYNSSNLGLDYFTNIKITKNISHIDYQFNNYTANITIPKDAEVQNFTITFYGYKTGEEEEVVITPSSNGGSGGGWYSTPKTILTPDKEVIVNITQNETIVLEPEIPIKKDNWFVGFWKNVWSWFRGLFK